jgi:hypothetical protein
MAPLGRQTSVLSSPMSGTLGRSRTTAVDIVLESIGEVQRFLNALAC